MTAGSFDDLLAEATRPSISSQHCWATSVEGDAKKLADILRAKYASGEHVHITATVEVFRSLGVTRGDIPRHIKGQCRCP